MKVFIYLLRDPYTLSLVKQGKHTTIRYIGKTSNTDKRWQTHFSGTGTSRMRKWILSLKKEGKYPKLEILEECEESNWHEREEFYIKKYLKLDQPLLNTYRGVKIRTNKQVRDKVKQQLLDGVYFKLKDDPDQIVVSVSKKKYYRVYGNLIKRRFNNYIDIKPGSYYVILSLQRYVVPFSALIYSKHPEFLPEIKLQAKSVSSEFIET